MPGIFITGTDTGVGKTFVTLALAKHFSDLNIDVGVMKPISCGPKKENDAVFLKKELNLDDSIELINPVSLRLPLAPYTAAKILKKRIDISRIFRAYKKLKKDHELVLVEGIGGALVPIKRDYFVADLIKDMGIPAIIVARAGLGTINHTLLTIDALRARKIEIHGVILNGYNRKDLSEKTNAEIIARIGKVQILAKFKLC
jgi:dethiobiotin synthetase